MNQPNNVAQATPDPPSNLPTPAPPGPALTTTANGLREISSAGVNYVNLMLGNMYWIMPTGPVLQLDGVWTYVALSPTDFQKQTGSAPNEGLNAYGAIAGRQAGYYALVDFEIVAKNLDQGRTDPITLMVVRDRKLAAQITNTQGSTMAVLAPVGSSASKNEKKSGAGSILIAAGAAAVGALVAGPGGALVAGGAAYLLTS